MNQKKRIEWIMIIIFFFFLESCNATGLTNQDITIETNPYPDDWITVGNQDTDYTSIQEAIDHALPGDTIYITSGTYSEVLHITKQVHLKGENKETTIIQPTSSLNSFAIHVAAAQISLQELNVSNNAHGIYTTAIKITQPNTTIESCILHNTPIGIACWSSDNVIIDSAFYQCRDEGIALLGSTHNKCNQNRIENCVFYENCDGIELQYSSNNYITRCRFYNQSHAAIDAIGQHNNNNIISNCSIHEQQAYGIFMIKSSGNKIVECTLNSLIIRESHENTLQNCEVDDISLSPGSHLIIEENTWNTSSPTTPNTPLQVQKPNDFLPQEIEMIRSSPSFTHFFSLITHNEIFKAQLHDYLLRIQSKNCF